MKGETEPVWRETLFLYVRDSASQSLTVHVEHAGREPEEANVLLGCAEIQDIKSLCDGKVHDLHLDLQGCELLSHALALCSPVQKAPYLCAEYLNILSCKRGLAIRMGRLPNGF